MLMFFSINDKLSASTERISKLILQFVMRYENNEYQIT